MLRQEEEAVEVRHLIFQIFFSSGHKNHPLDKPDSNFMRSCRTFIKMGGSFNYLIQHCLTAQPVFVFVEMMLGEQWSRAQLSL